MKNKYNMLIKLNSKVNYFIDDFIATKLNKKEFEKIQILNKTLLKDYQFIYYKDTEATWWSICFKLLTKKKLYNNCCFYCDFYGNIKKY